MDYSKAQQKAKRGLQLYENILKVYMLLSLEWEEGLYWSRI